MLVAHSVVTVRDHVRVALAVRIPPTSSYRPGLATAGMQRGLSTPAPPELVRCHPVMSGRPLARLYKR